MIETERLILRPLREEDRADFAAMNGDPRVGEWLGGVLDRADSDALMDRINAHIAEHGFGFWGAEDKAAGRLVGAIGLKHVDARLPLSPAVEVAWRLASQAWGRGLAQEGARAAIAWGFANLDLDEVVAFTAESNLRSQAVMRRLDMTRRPERDFEHPALPEGHPLRPHVVFAIDR